MLLQRLQSRLLWAWANLTRARARRLSYRARRAHVHADVRVLRAVAFDDAHNGIDRTALAAGIVSLNLERSRRMPPQLG